MKNYNHIEIEKKWQEKWAADDTFATSDFVKGKENMYVLTELPYPSGDLHTGHWYAFSVPDIYVRYHRANGKNVLYPIGFDSFGLPAENAAIERGRDPREWTESNIDMVRTQLKTIGATFDWSREISAHVPEYYRWTQWLFTKFFERGWVYKSTGKVNWCESCKTVLANEQVIDNHCDRCSSAVIEKEMPEWKFKITNFADRLLDDLDKLDWPEHIKDQQRNWIGKSEGVEIEFQTSNRNSKDKKIKVFTTRPDTLFGATFMVLAPEHKLVMELGDEIENFPEVEKYIKQAKQKDEIERTDAKREKTGIRLHGIFAINPVNNKKIPIFIADYVLATYGTGAIMAVPAHDERDFEFAQKYDIEIVNVVTTPPDFTEKVYTGQGTLQNSGDFDGMNSDDAKKKITEFVGGQMAKTYKLRDWSVSRQRYWGCPIPIVYDADGVAHSIPTEHLPWKLPEDVDFTPDGTAPLARSAELFARTEKIFGTGWTPDVETLDTFVDSSWYFYRYLDTKNSEQIFSAEGVKSWTPVDIYFGGAEHTTLHLLYSRFFCKMMYDLGLVDHGEPYTRRINRGLILAADGQKMSKSRGNGVNPDEQVQLYGADTVRMYLAFMGPYTGNNYPWNPDAITGVRRFLERVHRSAQSLGTSTSENMERALHKTIKKVGEDILDLKFNTAISEMMILQNLIEEKEESISQEDFERYLRILSAFAPHLTEELWEILGNTDFISSQPWPEYDPEKILADVQTIIVQVNGKLRAQIELPIDLSTEEIIAQAKLSPDLRKWLDGAEIKKEIYVPGKLVNFVIV